QEFVGERPLRAQIADQPLTPAAEIGQPSTKLRCTRAADTRRALPSYGVAITLSQPLSVSSKGPSLVITIWAAQLTPARFGSSVAFARLEAAMSTRSAFGWTGAGPQERLRRV